MPTWLLFAGRFFFLFVFFFFFAFLVGQRLSWQADLASHMVGLVMETYSFGQGVSESAQLNVHQSGLHKFRPTKLFVFGDSYADTGNNNKTQAGSWKVPYGITFPGKPSGRFSDGRVLTDYIAGFLGLKSPIAYMLRKNAVTQWKYGMNFAFGGTGVFDTLISDPNMTTQIDFFQNIQNECLYKKQDLKNSLILVTLSGNDYGAYLSKGGSRQGLPNFISLVIKQLAVNLKRIGDIGVGKVLVAALEPLGCLPQSTMLNSYKNCDTTANTVTILHNNLLQQAVAKLNNETKDSPFVILDLYNSFLTVFKNKGSSIGNIKFDTPLKPCCMGINATYFCGDLDKKGNKMYTVCSDPEATFFWDIVHPGQAGWRAVYLSLKSTLQKILS